MSGIPFGDPVALLRALVRVDSRNPALASDAPGEGAAAKLLAHTLHEWGMEVRLQEVSAGRQNVVARVGSGSGRSLLLNGHLDVVDVAGMTHAPFEAEERGGRLYGRGAADMKAGVAAMCAAAARASAQGDLPGQVIVTAVVDEEYRSSGTAALLEAGLTADAAIVTEPTRLAIAPAHKGFVWVEITVHGRAAHGSRYDLGVDAIRSAGLLLAEFDSYERRDLAARTHALLGHASVHASTIEGGLGWSTYPDRCVLRVERRTMPGENADQVVHEIEELCQRMRRRHSTFRADVRLEFAQVPSDVSPSAPIARELSAALIAEGVAPRVEGMSAWTDAALLNAAGIPAICFGPGDITLAHAAEEWVDLAEVERATAVLTRLMGAWGATESTWRS